ncbi:hypothetical protein C3941_25150 [Kaistia algarum]|uniref:RDD family protein n=1 Tax=Kaistia algarum TaxID=2083279 RepID=UPI000CE83125|nr:RDD family protein [Kaistia algarum]MCX5516108.1 RDD family protein [Kaistia algarum]PPE77159.1 hypothetical protein C3941_25150 [Kaistia algarum]
MTDGDWYFDNRGSVAGPMNFPQLRRMALTFSIDADTMVWRDGEPERRRLRDVIGELASNPPPAALEVSPPANIRVHRGWTSGNRSASRRFVARYIDLQIHGYIGIFLLSYGLFSFLPVTAERLVGLLNSRGGWILGAMAQALIAVPIGALIIGWSGFSLGKWLCGIRICDEDLRPIGPIRALERELDVYLRGLCLAIPLLFIICGVLALRRVKKRGTMRWDEYGIVVLARPSGALQDAMFVCAICLAIAIYVAALAWFRSHR